MQLFALKPRVICNVRSTSHRTAGFSILELIISIGVIFVLVTTAFVAFRSAKRSADRTTTRNALRQVMIAYTAYSTEHKGRLLPGYINPDDFDLDEDGTVEIDEFKLARLENGNELSEEDSAAYVWRLAPYVDHDWKLFMADYRSSRIEGRMFAEYGNGSDTDVFGPKDAGETEFGISRTPSFGLNSIFLGGDSFHGDGAASGNHPWVAWPNSNPESIAISRISQAKNPSKLIVFAPSHAHEYGDELYTEPIYSGGPSIHSFSGIRLGYVELRAPFLPDVGESLDDAGTWSLEQWKLAEAGEPEAGKAVPADGFGSDPGGVPIDRLDGQTLSVGNLDGSVSNFELIDFVLRSNVGDDATQKRWIMSHWQPH